MACERGDITPVQLQNKSALHVFHNNSLQYKKLKKLPYHEEQENATTVQ